MKIQSIIPLLALLAVSGTVSGQTARLYSPDNGLPNTQVNQICQDRSGIVWICTEGGLVRFDGVDFETFQRDRENPNSISSDSVHDIVEDVNGTMWVATASGLNLFDADYNSFHRYELRDERRPENIPYIVNDFLDIVPLCQCISNSNCLFVNLLYHEVVIAFFFGHFRCPVNGVYFLVDYIVKFIMNDNTIPV